MKLEKKAIYKPPQVELFYLGEGLNLMKHFSSTGGADDWNEGDLLDSEFGDLGEADDWGIGGGLDYE